MEKIKRKPIRRKARWAKKRKSRREDTLWLKLGKRKCKSREGIDGIVHISDAVDNVVVTLNQHLGDGDGGGR